MPGVRQGNAGSGRDPGHSSPFLRGRLRALGTACGGGGGTLRSSGYLVSPATASPHLVLWSSALLLWRKELSLVSLRPRFSTSATPA